MRALLRRREKKRRGEWFKCVRRSGGWGKLKGTDRLEGGGAVKRQGEGRGGREAELRREKEEVCPGLCPGAQKGLWHS